MRKPRIALSFSLTEMIPARVEKRAPHRARPGGRPWTWHRRRRVPERDGRVDGGERGDAERLQKRRILGAYDSQAKALQYTRHYERTLTAGAERLAEPSRDERRR
jgi:hypothetical protein